MFRTAVYSVFPSLCVPSVSAGNLATSPVPGTVSHVSNRHCPIRVTTYKMASARMILAVATIALIISVLPTADAGWLAYGLCQTGCNGVAVACYAAAGFTIGTVTAGAGIPAVIVGCSTALGACTATCAALHLAPTP
jgi:hypothetical protein